MSSSYARAPAPPGPQGYQSTGFVLCWRRYGLRSLASRFSTGDLPAARRRRGTLHRGAGLPDATFGEPHLRTVRSRTRPSTGFRNRRSRPATGRNLLQTESDSVLPGYLAGGGSCGTGGGHLGGGRRRDLGRRCRGHLGRGRSRGDLGCRGQFAGGRSVVARGRGGAQERSGPRARRVARARRGPSRRGRAPASRRRRTRPCGATPNGPGSPRSRGCASRRPPGPRSSSCSRAGRRPRASAGRTRPARPPRGTTRGARTRASCG